MTKGQHDAEYEVLNIYRCKFFAAQTLVATITEAKKSLGCKNCAEATSSKGKCLGPKMLGQEVSRSDDDAEPVASVKQVVKPEEPEPEPTPEPEAIKHDAGKARFGLMPVNPLMELVQVYTVGSEKYGERNWEKGLKWIRVFDAVMRHILAWRGGEDKDTEDGLNHLAHAAWGMFALMEYARTHPELDDR